VVTNNALPLIEVAVLMRLEPVGRGLPLAAGLATALFGVGALAVRLTLGASLGTLVVTAVAATAVYAAACWRLRGALQLDELAASFRPRPQSATVAPSGYAGPPRRGRGSDGR
jgi:hypothetical protein